MQIMITGLPSQCQQSDIAELLAHIGVETACEITLAPGLGEHPAALITLDIDHAKAEAIVALLDGHYWQGHTLSASHTTLFRT